jgi:hypothetical protein
MEDFYFIDKDVIICESSSGNKYEITEEKCTCKGFGFRNDCRHYQYCKTSGMIKQLKISQIEKQKIKNSAFILKMRKESLKEFCKDNNIKFDDKLISKVEPLITANMTPKQLIKILKNT